MATFGLLRANKDTDMTSYQFDWTNAGANGSYSVGTGADQIGVNVATTTNSAGRTGEVLTQGTPAEDALWVQWLDEPVTTTIDFDQPVENLSFELFDVDQGRGWDDRVTVIATNAAGEQVEVLFSDLDGLHSVTSGTVDADGNATGDVETSGAPDSVTVSIAGPITSLKVVFDNGESDAYSGVIGMSDLSFSPVAPVSDGIVSGTAGGDLIDLAYTGDPDGDMVTSGDDIIEAGDGDDEIHADDGNDQVHGGAGDDDIYASHGDDVVWGEDGDDFISGGHGDDELHGGAGDDTINGDEGNDTIYGGAGDDTSQLSTGNDTFYGGTGDDWVNGDYGDDVLFGGAGDDFLRGSFGNDIIYSGTYGEGDDYLWGGYNDDTFIIQNGFGNDSISGEDQAEIYGDILDLSGVTDDLWMDLTDANPGNGTFTDGTYTADYNGIEHIVLGAGTDTLILADYGGHDRVEGFAGPTDNGDGTYTGADQLDVSRLTSDWGTTPITTDDVTVSDDGSGNAVLSFPSGDSITLIGVAPGDLSSPAALAAIGIPLPQDGIVSGTGSDDVIGPGYVDADGDAIDNNDAILPGEVGNDDIIEAGDGNDVVQAGLGDDEVDAGAGNDVVDGGEGDDQIQGGAGNDVLSGGEGDDTLDGGAGADVVDGGAGNDTITSTGGSDVLSGGADRDTFLVTGGGGQVDGGEAGDDWDVLDLTGAGQVHVTYDPTNSENGQVEFLDESGNVTDTLDFENIEEVIPCFTVGTLVATSRGTLPIEELRPGDRVITRDRGYQEIRWIGRANIDPIRMLRAPHLAPIRIARGALGDGLPDRDIMVSPNHRMLIAESGNNALFGTPEVLVAAKHLVGRPGIEVASVRQTCYVHLMFDHHEVICADSAWSETFQPGEYTLEGMDMAQRAEIFELFPQLEISDAAGDYQVARPVLKRHEAALLVR